MNIAIVDDEEAFRNTLTEFLKRFFRENQQYAQGFSIEKFHDGEELLQGYTPRFDIIFLDIDMDAVNGMETAKRIREVDDMTAIIFVTRMARYALQGYSVAALDFILKPVDYTGFSIKLKRALVRVELERPRLIQVSQNGETHYINISKRSVKVVISLTDTCFAGIYLSSAYTELGTDFRLYHSVHIAVQDCKFQCGKL